MKQEKAEFIPTRQTLLSRLTDLDDHESWRQFFDTYWKLIYSVASKAGLQDAEAQEVLQETIIAVSRNIGTFKYEPESCSFKTWLMRVTRSRISNQFRKHKKHAAVIVLEELSDGSNLLDRFPDKGSHTFEAIWDAEWGRNLIDAAIDRVKRRIPAEQFHLFDFNVLREWPAAKVAKTFGVSTARVYLAKHRVSNFIKEEVVRIEGNLP